MNIDASPKNILYAILFVIGFFILLGIFTVVVGNMVEDENPDSEGVKKSAVVTPKEVEKEPVQRSAAIRQDPTASVGHRPGRQGGV